MKKYLICVGVALSFWSCNELMSVAGQVGTGLLTNGVGGLSGSVSNADNISGLKQALNLGIESAVSNLGSSNGFLGNAALKILLPEQAQSIVENIKLIPGGQSLVDKAVQSLNVAASDAVKSATPIFANAISNMSITDAAGILLGGKTAATDYLKKATYNQLVSAFAPKVEASLGKSLVGGASTSQIWNSLTSAYNTVAGTPIGAVANMKSVNVDLKSYVTQQALNALFTKIGDEETAIRTNPAARTTSLLKTVFGQIDSKK